MDKCLNHPWATDQDGFCWKCDEEKNQRHMREELLKEGIVVPDRLDSVVTTIIERTSGYNSLITLATSFMS